MDAKPCSRCKRDLPLSEFYAQKRNGLSGGPYYSAQCRACEAAWRKPRNKAANLKARYGMTLAQYDAMFAAQGMACAACASNATDGHGWAVDHDHSCCPASRSCGRCVRGILCWSCNSALGNARDSVERLTALIHYLERATANG